MSVCSFEIRGIDSEICIISLNESIEYKNLVEIRKSIIEYVLNENIHFIVINFEDILTINSLGMGMICMMYKECRKKNKDFILVNLSHRIKDLFKLMSMDKLIPILDSKEELFTYLLNQKKRQIINQTKIALKRKA